jgi:phosphatidylserine/phosphatidylglycerophosphate/cardiolipin synthase-like enzyme
MWTMGSGIPSLASSTDDASRFSRPGLHLGGPGEAPRALRDLLAAHVRAVPSGGRIAWLTYYFRDRDLARDLLDAHERGVDVRVLLEGRTRTRGANRAVVEMLRPVLGRRLRVVDRPYGLRVHAKIYLFAGPERHALIGSFNPSSDAVELEPHVIDEIGDQDRGFNLLVSLPDEALVDWLFEQTDRLHASRFARLGRFPLAWPRAWQRDGEAVWLLPRFAGSPLLERLHGLPRGARVRLAATHLSGRVALRSLVALAARGVRIEVLAESTERRVPRATLDPLRAAGIAITRVAARPHVPMHAKLTLIDAPGEREAWYGSANWSDRSFRRNFEVLARTRDGALLDGLEAYWERIAQFAKCSAAEEPE